MDDYRVAAPHSLHQLYHRRTAVTLSESDDDMVRLMGQCHHPPGATGAAQGHARRPLSVTKSYTGNMEESNRGQRSDALSVFDSFQCRSIPKPRNANSASNWQQTDCSSGDRLDPASVSPRISPVPWLLRRCFSNQDGGGGGIGGEGRFASTNAAEDTQRLLDQSPSKSSQRESSVSDVSTSNDSADDDDDDNNDDNDCTQHQQLRERRKAIFDTKSLCMGSPSEERHFRSPQDSREDTVHSSAALDERLRRRKKSSADLGLHYPGDLLSQARPRRPGRPLISRNTIADFANTKAYQTSTASLISAVEQDKKSRTSFSILKLIDKKSHRSKENCPELTEVLQNLKRSEFQDDFLTSLKGAHWFDLMGKAEGGNDGASSLEISDVERKRREAVWELFTSEYVFLVDHLMALKHCFMEPLKRIQVEGYLMFAEPQDLFGNLDEVCSVSHSFCREFSVLLLNETNYLRFGSSDVLIQGLKRFCQLTKDGEVYHDYCLNYSKATSYLEQLRKNDDFVEFEKWCEQDPRCNRLLLTDLLISPMQHCTKAPLLLNNICRYTENPDEQTKLMETLEQLETSLKNLEAKMNWLKNFERIQEIQQQIVWMSISELEPRAFIPEFLKTLLNRQPCERILANPKRQLLYEGPLVLIEVSKTVGMYMFLFDDILLLTKVKKPPRKMKPPSGDAPTYVQLKSQTEGATFTVYRQPIALDRFTIHDIRQMESAGMWCHSADTGHSFYDGQKHHSVDFQEALPDDDDDDCSPHRSNLFLGCLSAAVSYLRNAFVLVQITRFQQVIGVYTLQAPSESAKAAWMTRLPEAQDKYRRRHKPPTEARDHVTGSPGGVSSSEFGEDAVARQPHHHHHHQQQQRSPSPGSPRSPSAAPSSSSMAGGRVETERERTSSSTHRGPWRDASHQRALFDYSDAVLPWHSDAEEPSEEEEEDGEEEDEDGYSFSISRQVLCGSDTNSLSSTWSASFAPPPPPPPSSSSRASQYLGPSSQGAYDPHPVPPDDGEDSSEALDRCRAKSLRVRHRPNLRTIREKSQSIDTLHK